MNAVAPWDIFCRVVDNHGDIGVCWRLASDLAARGQPVRLWVDDQSALSWLAPGALDGIWPLVRVMAWEQMRDPLLLDSLTPASVWLEGFGCEIAPEYLDHWFGRSPAATRPKAAQPVWINLEYLSAENFAERSHGLPSPILVGPAAGCTRFFFYPGFKRHTGGLLREADLAQRQGCFERGAWLARQGIDWKGERLVSLFCYEPTALAQLLNQLRHGTTPTRLLVTAGRAAAAVRQLQEQTGFGRSATDGDGRSALRISFLPAIAQTEFDHLLWACDLNFVRGEDSLVRALWAGKPFVWQIYPQIDDAHHAKLEAFLAAVGAGESWRMFHRGWNSIGAASLPALEPDQWAETVLQAHADLSAQSDLTTRLRVFVGEHQPDSQNSTEKS